jgi:transposase
VCGSLGLFGAELVAIDGTFLKAVNSPRRNYSQGKVRRMIEEIDRRTDAYLEALEGAEREASAQSLAGTERAGQIQSKLAELEDKRRECEALLEKTIQGAGCADVGDGAAPCARTRSAWWAITRRSPWTVRSI